MISWTPIASQRRIGEADDDDDGTNGRGPAGAKAPVVGTDLKGHFGGESFPYGTNDRGPAGANAPAVGINLRGYFGGELFPHGTNYRGQPVPMPLLWAKT